MSKSKVLFLSIGNRDLQLPPNARLPRILADHFETGNIDTNGNHILKKSDKQFLTHSQAIWENYTDCSTELAFPMVEQSIESCGEAPQKIVVITTNQEPQDVQDCHYVALFLQQYLKDQGYDAEYAPITFPPVDLGQLIEFFIELYEKFADYHIYFGNSGGTPDMRAASHMAAMFRGVEFITVQARVPQQQTSNFRHQEALVLKHIVKNMLANYDYAGIQQLPLQNEQVMQLTTYALARLSLDLEQLHTAPVNVLLPEHLRIREKSSKESLMREVAFSALIKYHQKAYGDYVWRLFTIGDNLLLPYVEQVLEGPVVYSTKDNHQSWNDLISPKTTLIAFLSTKTVNKAPLDYQSPNAYAYEQILKYYESEEKTFAPPAYMWNIHKSINEVRGLRNGFAHNMKGINLDGIENKLSDKLTLKQNKRSEGLNLMLRRHLGIPETPGIELYDHINALIIQELEK